VRPSVDEAAISRDGRWLVLRTGSGGGRDLVAMRTGADSTLVPLVTSSAEEFSPALSPDGRWLAYGSDETGRTEVYVRPFPNASSAKYVISRGGGSEPQWSPAGGELFYRDGAGNLVAVAIAPGSEFRAASSQVLFPARAYGEDNRHHSYAVAPDGRSFVFARATISTQSPQQMVVTLNWFEELKRTVRP
jgi:serine/threonine-protein kinase